MKARVIHLNEAIHFTDLRRIIDGLNVDTDAFWVVRILAEITIKEAAALLNAATSAPMVHKFRQLLKVHEADIVEVSIRLPVEDDHLGRATEARAFRVRLMILAVVIHSVATLE